MRTCKYGGWLGVVLFECGLVTVSMGLVGGTFLNVDL